jgi:hypothetical protein
MAGVFIQQRQGSNTASSTQFISGSLTTSAGDTLVAIVTYFGATTTVSLNPDFGTWVEDVSLRHAAAGGVGMHVFTIDNCNAFTGNVTVTYGAARINRGVYVLEVAGLDHYISGVFPAYQVTPGGANDAITSGPYAVTNAPTIPNYLMGFVWDQTGATTTPPAIGAASVSLFTSQGTGWVFGSISDARVIDARVITDGNYTATFTSADGTTDTFAALLLAFAESVSTYTMMSQCMY